MLGGGKKQLLWGKLPSVILSWQQRRILCTCWTFVCVLTSQPALFDCSGSAYPCCGSVSACAHFVQGYKGATRIFSQCKLRSDLWNIDYETRMAALRSREKAALHLRRRSRCTKHPTHLSVCLVASILSKTVRDKRAEGRLRSHDAWLAICEPDL